MGIGLYHHPVELEELFTGAWRVVSEDPFDLYPKSYPSSIIAFFAAST